jgi:uncharacterized protein YegL
MAYSAEISRSNPTCFLFLVDQSGSMAERFGAESGRTKAQGLADAINRLLQTLVFRCAKGEYILDRYFIGVIGYGEEVTLGFPIDALAGSVLQPVSLIGTNPLRIEDRVKRAEDGAGGLIEQRVRFPVWFEPKAQGRTPMCLAIRAATEVIGEFLSQHPTCFPPVIINISDGVPTDGDPGPMAVALRSLSSQDGNALFFNVHISPRGERPVLFPADECDLPDQHAQLLFRMSSPLPPEMLSQAQLLEMCVMEGARGFAFNADLASVIMFLNIGTRVAAA